MKLTPELEKIRAEADDAGAAISQLCTGLAVQALVWRPNARSWSLAAILEHLSLTVNLCAPAVDRAIGDARHRSWFSDGPFQLGSMGRFFVWYVEPPPLIKLPAPRSLVPELKGPARDALSGFLASQQKIIERLEAANGIDLRRARFQSPFASFVRMDLLTLFSVYTAHLRRHLFQMKRLRERMEAG